MINYLIQPDSQARKDAQERNNRAHSELFVVLCFGKCMGIVQVQGILWTKTRSFKICNGRDKFKQESIKNRRKNIKKTSIGRPLCTVRAVFTLRFFLVFVHAYLTELSFVPFLVFVRMYLVEFVFAFILVFVQCKPLSLISYLIKLFLNF